MTGADIDRTAVLTAFGRRREPGLALAGDADRVSRACYDMALRFHQGAKLMVFGNGGPAPGQVNRISTDGGWWGVGDRTASPGRQTGCWGFTSLPRRRPGSTSTHGSTCWS